MIFNPVLGGGGGSTPALGSKTITANGTYLASSDNLDGYDEVTANVPNTYTAGDEGKVVSSGALVSQSSENITQNGTYDTTLKNSVTVNVSGGSGLGWAQITPTDLGAGSFLGSGSGSLLQIGTTYTSYRSIALDLSLLTGKMVYIDNTSNNRNFWGVYSALSNGAAITYPSSRQSTNGTLMFYADDLYREARYLVYDPTSASGNAPLVYVASVTAPA